MNEFVSTNSVIESINEVWRTLDECQYSDFTTAMRHTSALLNAHVFVCENSNDKHLMTARKRLCNAHNSIHEHNYPAFADAIRDVETELNVHVCL